MPPETYTFADHSFPKFSQIVSERLTSSGSSCIFSDWVVVGQESFASSSNSTFLDEFLPAYAHFLDTPHDRYRFWVGIGTLQRLTERKTQRSPLEQERFLDQWKTGPNSIFETRPVTENPLDRAHHWRLVESSGGFFNEFSAAELSVAKSKEKALLESALRASFESESLESGMDHPAEETISHVFRFGEGPGVLEWLREFCLDDTQPSFAASVIRCLGRQVDPGTEIWRAGLVRDSLALDDIEIRDAAVQAAESWGDPVLVHLLESHFEPVSWLQDYILDVIDDLRN